MWTSLSERRAVLRTVLASALCLALMVALPLPLAGSATQISWPASAGVTATFRADGARFTGDGWSLALTPVAAGWAGTERQLGAGALITGAAGVDYRWAGVSAWYRRHARGIEQGFTLARPPARPPGGKVTLRVVQRVTGDVLAVPAGDAVAFVDLGGATVATYDALKVWDASGRLLTAALAVRDEGLVIEVDATDALFPVTIDPVVAQQQAKLTAADGTESDRFGWAVAIDGDTALIGAVTAEPAGAGAVYVFTRDAAGTWSQRARLGPSTAEEEEFGNAVALDGGTALIGARGRHSLAPGAAYVFTGSGGSWTQQAHFSLPPLPQLVTSRFGWAVALDGDTALIGAPGEDVDGADAGAAYASTRTGSSWSAPVRLPSASTTDDRLGTDVALDGDTALVGSPQDDPGAADAGSAVLYTRPGPSGSWALQTRLTATPVASGDGAGDQFGSAVALRDGTALVGAPQDDEAGTGAGAVHVFTGSGAAWAHDGKLLPPAVTDSMRGHFGGAVSLDSDSALVGAQYDGEAGIQAGAAYLFRRAAAGGPWAQEAKMTPSGRGDNDGDGVGDNDGDLFGFSVALQGGTALIGAQLDDDIGTEAGAAYVFAVDFPPIADAGGPYTVFEGHRVTLDGTKSRDPEGAPLQLAWDFDADGAFDDATGPTPSFDASGLRSSGHPVSLQVVDAAAQTATATATVSVRAEADLAVSLSAPETAAVGASLPVTIGVRNSGPTSSHDVEVVLDVPAGLQASGTGSCSSTASGERDGAVRCPFGTLDTGTSRTVDLTLRPSAGGAHQLTARAGSAITPDPNTANNSTTGTVRVSPVTRLGGVTRISTALEISRNDFPETGTARAVVLARSDVFADALVGTPLAVTRQAPLLLTTRDRLLDEVAAEIRRVLPPGGIVYLLGGTAALSQPLAARIPAMGYQTQRLWGPNRFGTAVAIARHGLGNPGTILVADGSAFPDAISAGAGAGLAGGAVVLTSGPTMPPETRAYLQDRTGLTRYAVGGPAATADPSATRLVGATRIDTGIMVADTFAPSPTRVGFASAADFPDGLAGGTSIARAGGPLLLSQGDTLVPRLADYLSRHADTIAAVSLFGGVRALFPQLERQIAEATAETAG